MAPTKKNKTPDDDNYLEGVTDSTGNLQYCRKRARNNTAVKKSREKARKNTEQMQSRVDTLRTQNDGLESEVKKLQEHLTQLKEIFLDQASSTSSQFSEAQLEKILDDSVHLQVEDAVENLVRTVTTRKPH